MLLLYQNDTPTQTLSVWVHPTNATIPNMKYLSLIILGLCAPWIALAASYPAELIRVIDGDTMVLRWQDTQDTVRIIGIDTPEVASPYTTAECWGDKASEYATTLLSTHQPLTLDFTDQYDRYDRALGYITLADERDFGLVMIQNGYAYAYLSFPHDRFDTYTQTQAQAQANHVGLWGSDACHSSDTASSRQADIFRQDRINLIKHIFQLLFSPII